jgi:hypothetical protein
MKRSKWGKVKLSMCLTNWALCHKGVRGSGCIDPIFFTLALASVEWSASRPGRFTPGERAPGTHWIGDWVDPRIGLDDMEKRKFLTPLGLKLQPLGHPAHSQSLYRLHYPGTQSKLGHAKLILTQFWSDSVFPWCHDYQILK